MARKAAERIAKECPVCQKAFSAKNCGHGVWQKFCSKKCNKKQRDAGWKAARKAALARANHRCTMCDSTEDLEVHHIVEVANGGDHSESNLCVVCAYHHLEIHRQMGEVAA